MKNTERIERAAIRSGLAFVVVTTPGKGQGFTVIGTTQYVPAAAGVPCFHKEYPALHHALSLLPGDAANFIKEHNGNG